MNKQSIFNLLSPTWSRPGISLSRLKSFTNKPVVQAKDGNEVIICLNCESREEVDSLIAKATAAGARIPHPPEDHGFMYDQGFEDLDGHLWNLVWMAPEARESRKFGL